MPYGYNGKLLHIDLTERKVRSRPLDIKTDRMFLGGSGLGIKLLYDGLSAGVKPFDPDNILALLPGLLVGTSAPGSNRAVVCALSPATGIWGEARVGGAWGHELKYAGWDGLVVAGQASGPVYLWIENDRVEIRDAASLWGKKFFETDETLRGETTELAQIAAIGPGGEKRSNIACIMFENRFARAAGRCGLGAVMGAKNLKAVAVRGTGGIRLQNLEAMKEMALKFTAETYPTFKSIFRYGTAGTLVGTEAAGDIPVRNFLGGSWADRAPNIGGERLFETLGLSERSCTGCPYHCVIMHRTKTPPYDGVWGHAPEYETLAAFGTCCDNDHLESISMANELCSEYSLDTISAGVAVAFAIEAFEAGLLTTGDTDGLELTWGNHEAINALVRKIGEREGLGDVLADGVKIAAKKLGKKFEKMAMEVKGLEIPMHDPRAFRSNALNYAVATRGACHMDGLSFPVEAGVPMPDLGYTAPMDFFTNEGKAELTYKMHDLMCLYDALGFCKFYIMSALGPKLMSDYCNAATGWDTTMDEMMEIGDRIYTLKRLFNVDRGVTRKDDYLPARLLDTPQRSDVPEVGGENLDKLIYEYYQLRGWDENGRPTPEKLAALGLA